MSAQPTLFDSARLTLDDAIELTAASLRAYGAESEHWVLTYSGGKDSTTAATLVHHLVRTGRVPAPKSFTLLYADTRMELLPLHWNALQLLEHMRSLGVETQVVQPPLDQRFWVYMLGRGVPPPGPRFRWCVGLLKLNPMTRFMEQLRERHGKLLILTGVRVGESAARDQRIAISCSRDGSECSQGYFQRDTPEGLGAVLAPIIHWRVCHVFDWLSLFGPEAGYPTAVVAETYGGDEAEEINARTGCMACNVASKDLGLDTVVRLYPEQWGYLARVKRLRALYKALRAPQHRLRQPGGETKADGSLVRNQHRPGPLKMASREWALAVVLDLQAQVNADADRLGRPRIDILCPEEEARIREMWAADTWPDKWTGQEPGADEYYVEAGSLFDDAQAVAHA